MSAFHRHGFRVVSVFVLLALVWSLVAPISPLAVPVVRAQGGVVLPVPSGVTPANGDLVASSTVASLDATYGGRHTASAVPGSDGGPPGGLLTSFSIASVSGSGAGTNILMKSMPLPKGATRIVVHGKRQNTGNANASVYANLRVVPSLSSNPNAYASSNIAGYGTGNDDKTREFFIGGASAGTDPYLQFYCTMTGFNPAGSCEFPDVQIYNDIPAWSQGAIGTGIMNEQAYLSTAAGLTYHTRFPDPVYMLGPTIALPSIGSGDVLSLRATYNISSDNGDASVVPNNTIGLVFMENGTTTAPAGASLDMDTDGAAQASGTATTSLAYAAGKTGQFRVVFQGANGSQAGPDSAIVSNPGFGASVTDIQVLLNGKPLFPFPVDQSNGFCNAVLAAVLHCLGLDPVNTRDGTSHEAMTDVAAAPVIGPELSVKRTYSSLLADTASYGVGPLGPGWKTNYDDRLVLSGAGYETGNVILETHDGNRLRFYSDTTTTPHFLVPYSGVRASLLKASNGYTLTDTLGERSVFDTGGKLTKRIDGEGHEQTISYNGNGNLLTIANTNTGWSATYTYPSSGNVNRSSSVAVKNGSTTIYTVTYGYDSNGYLTSVILPNTATYTYAYSVSGTHINLASIKQLIVPGTPTDPRNLTQASFTYTSNKVTSTTDMDGVTTAIAYTTDSNGNPYTTMTRSATGYSNDVIIDHYRSDNTFWYQEENGKLTAYQTFGSGGGASTKANGAAEVTTIATNSAGLPLVAATNGLTTTYTYTSTAGYTNLPYDIVDAQGIKTSYRYDAITGDLKAIRRTSSDGSQTLDTDYTYNSNRQLTDVNDEAEVITHYTYVTSGNGSGNIDTMTLGYGSDKAVTTKYQYTAAGLVDQMTEAYGSGKDRVTKYAYDSAYHVTSVIQNYKDGTFVASKPDEDVNTSYGYDRLGRNVLVTDALGRQQATHYDAKGRQDWMIKNWTGTSSSYEANSTGQPVSLTFATATPDKNIKTAYDYDAFGRVSFIKQGGVLTGTLTTGSSPSFTNAFTITTQLKYDQQNRVSERILGWTPTGTPDTSPDHDLRELTYYDGAGRPIWQRDTLGRWTKTVYDANGRVTSTTRNYEDGTSYSVASGNASWATGIDTDITSNTYYDALGRVAHTVQFATDTTFREHDPDADVASDFVDTPTYDAFGRVTSTNHNEVTDSGYVTFPEFNIPSGTTYSATTGRMTATSNALGYYTSLAYDALGRVILMTQNCRNSSGTAVASGCDVPKESVAAYTGWDRNVYTSSTYDILGRVTDVTVPWWDFTTSNATTKVTHTDYDGLDRTIATTQNATSGGATSDTNVKTQAGYDAVGHTIAITDAMSVRSMTMTYNDLDQVKQATDAASRVTTYGPDGRWQKTPDGRYTVTYVDGLGRPSTRIENYTGTGTVTGSTPVDQNITTRYTYDAANRVVKTIRGASSEAAANVRVATQAYDLQDRVVQSVENVATTCAVTPCNVTTTYLYDIRGNLLQRTGPAGDTYTATYDTLGRAITEAYGSTEPISHIYDHVHLVEDQVGTVATTVRTYTYNELDAPAATTGADGAVQDHAYVGPGLLAYDYGGASVNYAGLTYSRDALGRVTQESRFWDDGTAHSSDPVGYSYTARGQRLQITYPNGGPSITYSYNNDSSMNEVKQAGNVVAQYGYDTAGRVSSLTRKNGSGTTVATTNYTFDGLGLPKTVTHVGPSNSSALGTGLGSISYTRNRLSEPTQIDETNPLKTSPSSTSLLDATIENNSLSGISGGTTPTIITTGALQGQYSAKVTVASSYLQKTLTTAVDEVFGTFLLKIDSTPSSTTRIAAVLNGSTTELELQLTTANRLRLRNGGTTIGSDSAALTVGTTYRVGFHQRKTTSGANGVMEAWVAAVDALPVTPFASSSTENLTAQAAQVRIGATTSTAAAVTLDTFQLDSAQWPVQLSGQKSKAYAHDGLGRVITAPSETFSYDASGNIIANDAALNGVTYDAADKGDAFSYDNRGNLTGDAANSYTLAYDDLDRLTARSLTGGSSVDTTSLYANRTLLGETRGTTVTTYTQSTGSGGLSQILQTRTGAGAATSYVYGLPGERLFEFSGSTRTWDIADERGSLRSQVSDSGVPSGRASYSAYGLQSREGSLNSPFGYLGEPFDPTWDMGWMRDRWYATGYGFFLGRDPIGTGNPYWYAGDAPLTNTDRSGDQLRGGGGGSCPPGTRYQPIAGCLPDMGAAAGAAGQAGQSGSGGRQLTNKEESIFLGPQEACTPPDILILAYVADPDSPTGYSKSTLCISPTGLNMEPQMWPRRAQPKATIVIPAYGIVCSTEGEQRTNPDEGVEGKEGTPSKEPTIPPFVRRLRDVLRKTDSSGWRAVTLDDITSGKLEDFVETNRMYHLEWKSRLQQRIAWSYNSLKAYAEAAIESPDKLRFWVLDEGRIQGIMQTGAEPRIPPHNAEFDTFVKPALALPMLQTFENRAASALKFAMEFSEQIGAEGRITTTGATPALERLYQRSGFIDVQPPYGRLYLPEATAHYLSGK